MDNRTDDSSREPKRAIKESVGIVPRDPRPATRGLVHTLIGGARPRTNDIGNDWRWTRDEHRQR